MKHRWERQVESIRNVSLGNFLFKLAEGSLTDDGSIQVYCREDWHQQYVLVMNPQFQQFKLISQVL